MSAKRAPVDKASADNANDLDAYNAAYPAFDSARTRTIVLYAASAAVLVTGYLLHRSAKKEASVQVGAAPLPEGGAFVSLEWAR
jgi:hypothetical protein